MATLLNRPQRITATVLFVIFMAAAAVAPFALAAAWHAGSTADSAKHDSRVNAAVASKGQDFASTAAKACQSPAGRAQLQRLGISCAQASQVATTPPTGAAGPQGIPGVPGVQGAAAPGPSMAAIEQAVAAYCASTTCGTGPTAAQVAQAVASFCRADGRCQGPSGPAGTSVTGPPGPSGETVTGPPGAGGAAGQNATADQIAAAVSDYCNAHGGCQGPPGQNATGVPGPPGPAGPPCSAGYSRTQQTVLTTGQGPLIVEMCTADDQTSPSPIPTGS